MRSTFEEPSELAELILAPPISALCAARLFIFLYYKNQYVSRYARGLVTCSSLVRGLDEALQQFSGV